MATQSSCHRTAERPDLSLISSADCRSESISTFGMLCPAEFSIFARPDKYKAQSAVPAAAAKKTTAANITTIVYFFDFLRQKDCFRISLPVFSLPMDTFALAMRRMNIS